jgi:isocitrate lyase
MSFKKVIIWFQLEFTWCTSDSPSMEATRNLQSSVLKSVPNSVLYALLS